MRIVEKLQISLFGQIKHDGIKPKTKEINLIIMKI